MNPLPLKADAVKVLTLKIGDEVKQITGVRVKEYGYNLETKRHTLTLEFEAPEE